MTIIDNSPKQVDVRGTIGDKIEFTLTFDGEDYSTYSANAAVKTTRGGVVHTLVVDDTDANIGTFVITLDADTSSELENTNDWDLQVDDGSGPQTIAAGQFILRSQVST